MSTIIKTIKDFFDNTVYPITKTNAVYDSNNNRLDNVLASKQDASSNFVYKGTGSATPSIDDPELRKSDISTTQSTSDITVPSSSLVKTMNDNLGNPSSASAVTGADAFSKISKLNSELANFQTFTAQSPSSVSGSKTTALPTGFNGGNCVIIGAKIEVISNFYYSVATLAQNGVDLVLSGTTIYVTTSATTPSNYLGKDIIITLYKHA